jgi:UDP-N-acetylglucosamine 1-carboxyvinyltransferase
MAQYVIHGGRPLEGEVTISGAKNAAVAILPAALLVDGVCRIENVPDVSDIQMFFDILTRMGATVRMINKTTFELDCSGVHTTSVPHELASQIRASYYLVGALLGRFGKATVSMPGGCDFGVRPIDQHIKGFNTMGADVQIVSGDIIATTQAPLHGSRIYLDVVSVGATMNIMIAAVLAEGLTIIENAAKEPHIVDLANFLNAMGANVSGAGTDVIKVRGVKRLRGGSYSIIPDQIEAGTYMAAVAAAGGKVLVKNVIPKHLDCITAKLREMGVSITDLGDSLLVESHGRLKKAKVKTMPHPGFPTDMQPQITVCMSLAEGTSVVTEGVWDNRFRYIGELRRMGAQIQVDGKVAIVEGVEKLRGCPVKACDLRAGAAMVIAGLAAEGTTTVSDIKYVERGYENLSEKLQALGADFHKVEGPEPRLTVISAG